ncbi:LutC/YkgG family protein [Halopiger xanaduensis]|uniref:Lactate utilization protein B/C n=1 Tax=Halopiger xanaduensis (strain DSM 18323 / JCM 14033 / SH-6) TaxID=797210 RepID=F8D3T5_HALXS|nr:LUD domain-containing protein [Halopiger xanaduensis]AEH38588.1 Lactate utilization protein B/C [Halopiger xanaduensis SH-6]
MVTQLETFETNLGTVRTDVTRATPSTFEAAIADAIVEPAVGTPLPFEEVSLASTDVVRDPTPAQLRDAACGVTAAAIGVADYGSVVLEATPDGAEFASLFPDRHVVVLRERDIVSDMAAAFERLGDRFRDGRDDAVIATGPSATADMGELVHGVHGPRETHAIILESEGEEQRERDSETRGENNVQ